MALESAATEVLFGGAAGGGKSHLMRIAAIMWCASIAGLQVYLFRRIRADLVKNHMEGPKGFHAMLAPWVAAGWCQIIEDEIRFWNGSRIYLCHCEHEKHIYKYQGAEIHVLIIDELTHFTEVMYRFLRNRVRMVGVSLPAGYVGKFPRILCGANPGNIGHLFVKNTFIVGAQELAIRVMPGSEGGMRRQYIPARLEDNPSMGEDDPGYEGRLEGLGSKSLVAAMRWGDWDVVEGAFFDCWSHHKHVLAPFSIPRDWLRFRSGDWGSASPFSFGWWAVVQDDFQLDNGGTAGDAALPWRSHHNGGRSAREEGAGAGATRTLPRGALVRYREDYGDQDGQPGKGLKLTAEQVADRIIAREKGDPKLTYGRLDPSTFKTDGGPSIAERINTRLVKAQIVPFSEADNRRVTTRDGKDRRGPMGGWDQMRARLIGDAEGRPMLYVFSTCFDTIRTVPVLQHDSARVEDLDTNSEDHCFAGETLVATQRGTERIDSLPPAGIVWDAEGRPQHYRNPRLTRRKARVVRLSFDDGSSVVCTPDHRFKTVDGRWVEAQKMLSERSYASILATWMGQSSSANRCKHFEAAAITGAVATSNGAVRGSTASFGRPSMAQSLAALISTTRTGTTSTTHQKIWSALRPTRTWPIMGAYGLTIPRLPWQSTLDHQRHSGTPQRRGALGTRRIGEKTSNRQCSVGSAGSVSIAENGSRALFSAISFVQTLASLLIGARKGLTTFSANVLSAVRPFWRTAIQSKSPALDDVARLPPLARGRVCLSVDEAGRADVYCLSVPESGSFHLANGIAVANCADDIRYACMSRPWVKPSVERPTPKDAYRPPSDEIPQDDWKVL